MNELEDSRDRTIFIEWYPDFRLICAWRDNGTVAWYTSFPYPDDAANIA